MTNRVAVYQPEDQSWGLGVHDTRLNWSVAGDMATVEFRRGPVQQWIFMATPNTVRDVLRLVGECARDNDQSLTWRDAVRVTDTLRSLVRETPVVAMVLGYVDDDDVNRIYVGLALMGGVAFLVCVVYVIVGAMS